MNINDIQKFLNLDSCHLKRTVQMLVAASVAIIIAKALHLHYGYWIALSSIITIQANTGASMKRARERMFGTIMGVIVGVAIMNIFPQHYHILLIAVPILIFLTVYLFNSSYAYSIFFVSILLIILMSNSTLSPWGFAFDRVVDTAIGLVIGIAACYLLWPNASQDELQQSLRKVVCACRAYFVAVTDNFMVLENPACLAENKRALESNLLASINTFKMFSYEPGIMKVTAEAVYAFIININTIYSSLEAMNLAARARCLEKLDEEDKVRIAQFIEKINAGFKQIEANFWPNLQQKHFNFAEFSTDISLIAEQKVKTILQARQEKELSLILFAYELKKIAFELKYMHQAVEQLTEF